MNLSQIVPLAGALANYNHARFRSDLVAGLTTAIMLIPQGMGYAMLAGLPPIYGLYASLLPTAVYALFGTSRQLSVGPVALVSLLVAAGVAEISGGSQEAYIAAAISLACLVGILQIGLGLFRLGFLVNFLSHPVVSGFTSAAGLLIGFSQLKHLLGVPLPRTHYVHVTIQAAIDKADAIHGLTFAIGIGATLALIGLKRWAPRFPRALLVVAFGTLGVWGLGLHDMGVAIVGPVPSGLPPVGLPELTLDRVRELGVVALTITLVGFMGSIAIARRYATEQKYHVDANRELVSLGLANLLGSFTGAFPSTGGLSRTVVNAQAGATSGVAGLVTATLVGLTLSFFTSIFYFLPKVVLAAIIMTAAISLIDIGEARYFWKVKRSDLVMMLLTLAGTLVLGIEAGILVGVGASLAAIVLKSTLPHVAVLGRLPGTRHFRNVNRFSEAVRTPSILALRVDSQFYFGNVNFLKETMARLEGNESAPLEAVILDASGVNRIDASAVAALTEILEDYQARSIRFVFTDVKGPVRDVLARSKFFEQLGEDNVFFDVDDAMNALLGSRDLAARPPLGFSVDCLRPVPEWPSNAASARIAQGEKEMKEFRVNDNLICGGQPALEDLKRYHAEGIRTVVNMREPTENGVLANEKEQVEALGMHYVAFPVNGETQLTPERAGELATLLRDVERPVLLHCGSSNRVGALLALSARHDEGLPVKEAIAFGKKAGLAAAEAKISGLM